MRQRWNRTWSSNSTLRKTISLHIENITSGVLKWTPLDLYLSHLFTDFLGIKGRETLFTEPSSEPAFIEPDSVSWRVFANPVTLFVGGVAAVILELAEPRVRHGVWTQSDFQRNPKARLQRTGLAAMITVYASQSTARGMIAKVVQRHANVSGIDELGRTYSANDPELLNWVQTTASFGFIQAYHRFAGPLSQEERDQAYREAMAPAALYGVTASPCDERELDLALEAWRPYLSAAPQIHAFIDIMRRTPILPPAARWAQGMLIDAAIDIVPNALASQIDLDKDKAAWSHRKARMVGALAQLGNSVSPTQSPRMLSSRRLLK